MPNKAYQIAFDGEAVDEEFYGDIVSLTVVEQITQAAALQLRLALRLEGDGSWSYLDDDRLALWTPVAVKIGFMGGGGIAGALGGLGGGGDDGLVPVFDGYITAVNVSLGSQPGETTLDITVMDGSVLMSLEEKIAAWPNLSDSDIVQQIVAGYDVAVQADPTPTVHQENTTTIMQRGTDIQFVRELAQRNGFEFYFEPDQSGDGVTAYFRLPQVNASPQPDLAIQFGDESNLRSFNVRVNGQRPLNIKTQQIDVETNSANTAEVGATQLRLLGDKDMNTLIGGPLEQRVTPKAAQAQMLVLGPPTSDPTELRTIAQAVRDEAGWFLHATGEINSDAYGTVLRPHRPVLVKGAGSQYSGAYYVIKVTHTLKSDGSYTQQFEARRNARDLLGNEQFGGSDLGLPF